MVDFGNPDCLIFIKLPTHPLTLAPYYDILAQLHPFAMKKKAFKGPKICILAVSH